MERGTKLKSAKELERIADKLTSDDEQELWENKKLGATKKYAKKSRFFKTPAKLISIRVPEELLDELKDLAETEGLRHQTYIVSLLIKHVNRKKKN